MKTFFIALGSAFIGALLAIGVIVLVAIMSFMGIANSVTKEADQGSSLVLSLDLRQSLNDLPSSGPLSAIFGGDKGFIDLLDHIDSASKDDAVKGIFIRASEGSIGSSRAEELREALIDFKASGKFVVAHSQGSYGGGPSGVRAISAADEIYIQPGADTIASGISFETMFFKDLFDNLSISAEIEQFYEFKNSPSVYKETGYTEPHRLAMTALAESVWQASLDDIAADRGLGVGAVKAALESSPLSAERMVALDLADDVAWPEDVMDMVKERGGDGTELLDIMAYKPAPAPAGAPVIAIVGGEGAIVTGESEQSFFNNSPSFHSDTIARAILDAGDDEDVKAIVFRVDSPGGSPTASDQVWRAVKRVQEQGKPVVVSMGSVAASGGYYVSTGADWIVANRTTITGSLGIFGGKIALADGLRRIGVNTEAVTVGGPFAGAFTSVEGFTDEQREMLHGFLKRGYDRFLTLVAEGRGMTYDEVNERARGRVWSGEDALAQGLVDELGGLKDAVAKAKDLSGIDADTQIRTKFFPLPDTSFFGISTSSSASASELAAIAQLGAVLGDERAQLLLQELQAMDGTQIQARAPHLIER